MLWMLVVLALTLVEGSYADPRQWNVDGVAVREATTLQNVGKTARADDGSLMTVWARSDREYARLFGQRLSPTGERLWEFNGRLLAHGGERGVDYPNIVYTGDGFIVVWMKLDVNNLDEEVVLRGSIRAMKYAHDGTPLWDDPESDGVLVQDGGDASFMPELALCDDGGGGAFVQWSTTAASRQWFMQRIGSNGENAWTLPVELATAQYWSQYSLVADGAGNVLACWNHNDSLFIQKYNGDGGTEWNLPTLIAGTENFYRSMAEAVPDGVGGAMICWLGDWSNGSQPINAQRIDGNGELMWSGDGIPVRIAEGFQSGRVAASWSGGSVDGLLVMWREDVSSVGTAPFAQKVSLDGGLLWPGSEVCPSQDPQDQKFNVQMSSDFRGGMVVTWFESPNNLDEIMRLARLDENGNVAWNVCSVELESGYALEGLTAVVGGENTVHTLWHARDSAPGLLWSSTRDIETGAETSEPQALNDLIGGDAPESAQMMVAPGRTAFVWRDTRSPSFGVDLYFNVVNAEGNFAFDQYGEKLVEVPAPNHLALQDAPLCSDGAGGFFCTFEMLDQDEGIYEVRVTRRTAEGVRVGPAGGLTIEPPQNYDQQRPRCVPDGAGGAFVVWTEFDLNFQMDVWVQRVNAQCEPVWNEPLRIEASATLDEELIGLVSSADGSCIVTYRAGEWEAYQYRAARITANGDVLWDAAVSPIGRIHSAAVIADSLGLAVSWRSEPTDGQTELRVQRINADGVLRWPLEGIPVDLNTISHSRGTLGLDEQGNLFVSYLIFDSSSGTVHAQKITPTGGLAWGEMGREVAVGGSADYPEIAVLNSQNIYVAWSEWASGRAILRMMHFDSQGELAPDAYWDTPTGAEVCALPTYQTLTGIAPDGLGGIVVRWSEHLYTSFDFSLAAQRIFDPIAVSADDTPVVPSEFALAQNYPNPFNPETVIEFSLPGAAVTSLKVFDVLGREVATLVGAPMNAGVHRVTFDASAFSSGVYFYRVEAGEFRAVRKMVLLK